MEIAGKLTAALLLVVLIEHLQSADAGAEEVTVTCPAIEHDERRRTNYPGESEFPICLVVQGQISTITGAGGGDGVCEIEVEKVIYGASKLKKVRFNWPWRVASERAIVALSPALYGEVPYAFRYMLSPDELSSQEALARARLDFRTLSSEAIFVGKELSADNDYRRTVKVLRSLHGPVLAKGDKVTTVDSAYIRHAGERPAVRSAPMIYFVRRVAPPRRGEAVVYYLSSRIVADQEPAVLAALKRRDSYPVRPHTMDNGKTIHIREVTFKGSATQAVELMGSKSEAAVTLGTRKLLLSGDAGRAAAVAEIKKHMTPKRPQSGGDLRRLRNLIRFLGASEKGDEDLAGLLDRMISGIVAGTPPPRSPKREAYDWRRREADRLDTNHALLWLLKAMDKEAVLSKYATRLIKLRDGRSDEWKNEIQLALEAANILDGLELKAALAKGSKLTPARVATGFAVAGEQVVFSPTGKQLIVDGKIHETSGWSETGVLKTVGDRRALFAPDGKRLFVLGDDQADVVVVQWPSGKILSRFKGHKRGITSGALSADGKTLLTISYYEPVAHVWDTTSGKIVHSHTLNKGCYDVALSPNGKMLVFENTKHELMVQPIAGGKTTTINIDGHELNDLAFTPDGKHLVVLSYSYSKTEIGFVPRVAVHAVDKGYAKIANLNIKGASNRCTTLAISPNGQQLVVGSQEGRVWAADLPTLKKSRSIIADEISGNIDAGQMAFSTDGKLLAVGASSGNIRLFDVNGFKPVTVGPAHQGELTDVYFSASGKEVRTFGEYGFVCRWDTNTLQLKNRFALPSGTRPIAVRSPDGKFVFCASAQDTGLFVDRVKSPVNVVNVENGKSVAEFKIPVRARVQWIGPQQAIVRDFGTWQRVDYVAGKELKSRETDIDNESELFNRRGEATEDGKGLLLWNRTGGKFATNTIEVWTVDIETGKPSKKTKTPQIIRGGYNASGLVPGGKYFYIADPDMYILNRTTGKAIAHRSFGKSDLLEIAFSPNGPYYAVVTGGRIVIDGSLRQWDSETTSLVRIHETISGKTVLAFPAPTRWVRKMRFSPDGKRLLVAGKDVIEIWPLQR